MSDGKDSGLRTGSGSNECIYTQAEMDQVGAALGLPKCSFGGILKAASLNKSADSQAIVKAAKDAAFEWTQNGCGGPLFAKAMGILDQRVREEAARCASPAEVPVCVVCRKPGNPFSCDDHPEATVMLPSLIEKPVCEVCGETEDDKAILGEVEVCRTCHMAVEHAADVLRTALVELLDTAPDVNPQQHGVTEYVAAYHRASALLGRPLQEAWNRMQSELGEQRTSEVSPMNRCAYGRGTGMRCVRQSCHTGEHDFDGLATGEARPSDIEESRKMVDELTDKWLDACEEIRKLRSEAASPTPDVYCSAHRGPCPPDCHITYGRASAEASPDLSPLQKLVDLAESAAAGVTALTDEMRIRERDQTSDSTPTNASRERAPGPSDEKAGTANAAAPSPGGAPKSPGATSAASPNASVAHDIAEWMRGRALTRYGRTEKDCVAVDALLAAANDVEKVDWSRAGDSSSPARRPK